MQATRTFTAAAQTLDADLGPARHASISVTGAMTGTIVPQVSRDGGATYDTCPVATTAGAVAASITAAGRYYPLGIRPGDKLRLNCTALTAGTPVGTIADA